MYAGSVEYSRYVLVLRLLLHLLKIHFVVWSSSLHNAKGDAAISKGEVGQDGAPCLPNSLPAWLTGCLPAVRCAPIGYSIKLLIVVAPQDAQVPLIQIK